MLTLAVPFAAAAPAEDGGQQGGHRIHTLQIGPEPELHAPELSFELYPADIHGDQELEESGSGFNNHPSLPEVSEISEDTESFFARRIFHHVTRRLHPPPPPPPPPPPRPPPPSPPPPPPPRPPPPSPPPPPPPHWSPPPDPHRAEFDKQ